MKKIVCALATLLFSIFSFAFNTHPNIGYSKPAIDAATVLIPIGKSGKKISLLELSYISRSDMEKLTGRKMNLPQRWAFRSAQRRLRDGINEDGIITNKKLQKMFFSGDGQGGGFHIGGFALGFLLGLIGVLIAYLINDDMKHRRVKWAWVGFGVVVVFTIISLVSVL